MLAYVRTPHCQILIYNLLAAFKFKNEINDKKDCFVLNKTVVKKKLISV